MSIVTLTDRYLAKLIALPLFATLILAAMLLLLDKMLRLFDFVVTVAFGSSVAAAPSREAGSCNYACVDGSPLARGSLSVCSCWLVRPCIRPVGAACHMPLAIMPFARLRSRSTARTRSARPQWVFLIRRFQPASCISSYPPFPTSSAPPRLPDLYASVTTGSR